MNFTYFSKDSVGLWDMYEDVLAPYYQDGFIAETWGRPYDPSFCVPKYKYNVLNVLGMNIGKYAWYNTDDHSKWGIAINFQIYCSSDINRMNSQRKRGGGALCTNSPVLYNAYKGLITLLENCKNSYTFLQE